MASAIRDFVGLVREPTSRRRQIGSWSEPETLRLRELASAIAAGEGPNAFLRRAAILHSDTALGGMAYMDRPPTMAGPEANRILPPLLNPLSQAYVAADPNRPSAEPGAVTVDRVAGFKDGQIAQFAATRNWEFARKLLDWTAPRPRGDRRVLSWYRDVAAELAGRVRLGELKPHLIKAVDLFPGDAPLLLGSGCLHETLASARVQAVAAHQPQGPGDSWTLDVGERGMNLSRAASFFRRSMQSDPTLVEARVRLARVLTLQGRTDEAADLLRSVSAQTDDHILLFWGELFLGNLEERRGRLADAKAAYERARILYPKAQSMLLGLAAVTARISPAQQGSVDAWPTVDTPDQKGLVDPWRVYHLCLGRAQAAK